MAPRPENRKNQKPIGPGLHPIGGNQQYVYFAHRDGLIKIGCSTGPDQRVQALRADLIGWEPGSFYRERVLHERFAATRVTGEWFRMSPEIREYITRTMPWAVPRLPPEDGAVPS